MTLRLDPELRLGATCCRWPMTAASLEAVGIDAEKVRDWWKFAGVVDRNRIAPHAHRSLLRAGITLPSPIADHLATRAASAAQRALVLARESLRLQCAFDKAGLRAMIVKGSPLAILAYRDLGQKESWDIDLLVSPDSVRDSANLLIELGYVPQPPDFLHKGFAEVVRYAKEAVFYHAKAGITTELHWKLVDNPQLLKGVDVHSPAQEVEIGGDRLRTLARDELFAYLCVHGAMHNWGRLKWLADVAALLGSCSELEVATLHTAAGNLGVGRPATVAFMLCDRLMGSSHLKALQGRTRSAAFERVIEWNVLAGLSYQGGASEQGDRSIPWMRMIAAQLVVAPGLAHLLRQARTLWNFPIDRAALALPQRWTFLYHLLRIPLWLGRYARRALSARSR